LDYPMLPTWRASFTNVSQCPVSGFNRLIQARVR
jgi:hypothetical protein